MTQRNYNNPRNQARGKHGDGIKGVSRKSASSAKLKSQAGASVYVRSADSKKKGKLDKTLDREAEKDRRSKERRREAALGAQLTSLPEYKKWRRIWWVVIIIAVVAVVASFALGQLLNTGAVPEDIGNTLTPALLVLGYGGIIAALAIDLGKIRRMRKNLEGQAHTMSARQLRQLDAEIERNDRAQEAARAQRKKNRPWNRNKDASAENDTDS